jgi:hypothetical protein
MQTESGSTVRDRFLPKLWVDYRSMFWYRRIFEDGSLRHSFMCGYFEHDLADRGARANASLQNRYIAGSCSRLIAAMLWNICHVLLDVVSDRCSQSKLVSVC